MHKRRWRPLTCACLIFRAGIVIDCNERNNNNNRRLVTLAEHTSDHGRQTNSSTIRVIVFPHLIFDFDGGLRCLLCNSLYYYLLEVG